jgi:hypothetical protein
VLATVVKSFHKRYGLVQLQAPARLVLRMGVLLLVGAAILIPLLPPIVRARLPHTKAASVRVRTVSAIQLCSRLTAVRRHGGVGQPKMLTHANTQVHVFMLRGPVKHLNKLIMLLAAYVASCSHAFT